MGESNFLEDFSRQERNVPFQRNRKVKKGKPHQYHSGETPDDQVAKHGDGVPLKIGSWGAFKR